MSPIKLLLSLVPLGLLLHAPIALALPDDRDQPIEIAADSAELDDQKGISTYIGQVKLTQGSLEIEGDKVTIYSDDDGVRQVIAVGRPAHFKQQPNPEDPLSHGYARRVEYDVNKDEITLLEDARLIRDRDTFSGKRIHLNIESDVVSAFGNGENRDQRVNMVLQPKKDKDQ